MGVFLSFPFLFPSLVEKRTVVTEFWYSFIPLHAGDVNQNGPGYAVLDLSGRHWSIP